MAVSSWLILKSGAGQPAENMACDEALLEVVSRVHRPALRFYSWTAPAATFGYFQRFADVSALTTLRPLIRRPTGGGLVPHDNDWTYSVAIPPDDAWFDLKAVESYRRIHEWLQATFQKLNVATTLSPARIEGGPGQCFVGAETFDLLHRGTKIAGAAQRRRKDGLLIQGSIQAGPTDVNRAAFEQTFAEVASARWNMQWEEFHPPAEVLRRVRQLAAEKYSRPEYNDGR